MYYTQMDFVLLTNGCENRATPLIWLDTLQALHTIGHCEGCCCTRTIVIFRCVHLFQHKLVEMSCAGNANQNRILKGEINFSGKYWGCFALKTTTLESYHIRTESIFSCSEISLLLQTKLQAQRELEMNSEPKLFRFVERNSFHSYCDKHECELQSIDTWH